MKDVWNELLIKEGFPKPYLFTSTIDIIKAENTFNSWVDS